MPAKQYEMPDERGISKLNVRDWWGRLERSEKVGLTVIVAFVMLVGLVMLLSGPSTTAPVIKAPKIEQSMWNRQIDIQGCYASGAIIDNPICNVVEKAGCFAAYVNKKGELLCAKSNAGKVEVYVL